MIKSRLKTAGRIDYELPGRLLRGELVQPHFDHLSGSKSGGLLKLRELKTSALWRPWLVGGWATPLKNMNVNWMIIPNIWENKNHGTVARCETTSMMNLQVPGSMLIGPGVVLWISRYGLHPDSIAILEKQLWWQSITCGSTMAYPFFRHIHLPLVRLRWHSTFDQRRMKIIIVRTDMICWLWRNELGTFFQCDLFIS